MTRGEVVHRILIVDDDADNTDLLSMLLTRLGHICACAYSGVEALELVATFQPTVIMLDIVLPELDGYRVAREVRVRNGSQPYIAAVTGLGTSADRETALAAGIDEHLAKPVEKAVLVAMIARAAIRLDASTQQREHC